MRSSIKSPLPFGSRSAFFVVSVPFLFTLTLFYCSLPPGITFEDAGIFISAAATGGYPHPPGYPLYTLILKSVLYVARLFDLSPARSGAFSSALFAALSSSVLSLFFLNSSQKLKLKTTTSTYLLSIFAGILSCLSLDIWRQSNIIEVYALHVFLFSALLLALSKSRYFLAFFIS